MRFCFSFVKLEEKNIVTVMELIYCSKEELKLISIE